MFSNKLKQIKTARNEFKKNLAKRRKDFTKQVNKLASKLK
jgi:hypothetical protein